MTKFKHTTGHWETSYSHTDKCFGVCEKDGGDMIADFINEANARLIAASPDLLDILETIVECGFLDNALSNIKEEAQAAINKARGE